MTSLPRGNNQVSSWPPRYLSPVNADDLARSRGDHVIDFAQALCTITKDSIAGNAGSPLVFRDWQKELTRHLLVCLERMASRHGWLLSFLSISSLESQVEKPTQQQPTKSNPKSSSTQSGTW